MSKPDIMVMFFDQGKTVNNESLVCSTGPFGGGHKLFDQKAGDVVALCVNESWADRISLCVQTCAGFKSSEMEVSADHIGGLVKANAALQAKANEWASRCLESFSLRQSVEKELEGAIMARKSAIAARDEALAALRLLVFSQGLNQSAIGEAMKTIEKYEQQRGVF